MRRASRGSRGHVRVDKVLVINLERRKDRWRRLRDQLHRAGIGESEPVEAVDDRALDLDRVSLAPGVRRGGLAARPTSHFSSRWAV